MILDDLFERRFCGEVARPSIRIGRHCIYWKLGKRFALPIFYLPQDQHLDDEEEQDDEERDNGSALDCGEMSISTHTVAEDLSTDGKEPVDTYIGSHCADGDQTSSTVQHHNSTMLSVPSEKRQGDDSPLNLDPAQRDLKTCEEDICLNLAQSIRHFADIEVTSAENMLEFLNRQPDHLLDILCLRIKVAWVTGDAVMEANLPADSSGLSSLRAKRNQRARATTVLKSASPPKVQAALDSWLEMLDLLSRRAIDIKELNVHVYGYEFCTNSQFVQRLAQLKVSQGVVLHGAFSSAWQSYLRQTLKVEVLTAYNCHVIKTRASVFNADEPAPMASATA